MEIHVNGRELEVADRATVADLVAELGYTARQVVVELNGGALERARFSETELSSGDVVEVVRAVAGG